MWWLRAVSVLSVCFLACSRLVVANEDQQETVETLRQRYQCQESSPHFDCVFNGVHITAQTQNISFGHEDVTLNTQKQLTFRNSTVRVLPEALLRSFRQAELLELNDLQMEKIEKHAFITAYALQRLYMRSNKISNLPPNAFLHLQSLTVLELNRNSLKHLPPTIFYGTPNLMVLSISNNNIKRIEDKTFETTTMLQDLRVSSNKLTYFNTSLIPSLFHCNISFNRLTTLTVPIAVEMLDASHNHLNAISGPANDVLAVLKLQHNDLTDTAWLLKYSGLVELDLSYNDLEAITYKHFEKMTQLERLYVSNNRLVELYLYKSPIPTLTLLDVSHNHLMHVVDNRVQFDTVKYLYLDHNSIVTLNLSSDHTVSDLTLSHNEWNCRNLRELFRNVSELVVQDADQHCKPGYQLEHGLCCKETLMPYHDQLVQYIVSTIVVEKLKRIETRCSGKDVVSAVKDLSDNVTQWSRELDQLETEINQLQATLRQLTDKNTMQDNLLNNLHARIDANLRRYGLNKDEQGRPVVNLKKLLTHLKQQQAIKLREAEARPTKLSSKLKEMKEFEQKLNDYEKMLIDIRTL